MALLKTIELESGVLVNYHRVTSINTITNSSSIIEVTSYTSEAKRTEEKTAQPGDEINVFTHTNFINVAYDKSLNVDSAYAYIKGLPIFQGATDV